MLSRFNVAVHHLSLVHFTIRSVKEHEHLHKIPLLTTNAPNPGVWRAHVLKQEMQVYITRESGLWSVTVFVFSAPLSSFTEQLWCVHSAAADEKHW